MWRQALQGLIIKSQSCKTDKNRKSNHRGCIFNGGPFNAKVSLLERKIEEAWSLHRVQSNSRRGNEEVQEEDGVGSMEEEDLNAYESRFPWFSTWMNGVTEARTL